MALNLDTLSLWEIAFRWHELDPHRFETIAEIPLPVKDTLRTLASEVYYEHLYSKLWLEREEDNRYRPRPKLFQKPRKMSVSDYRDEFHDCVKNNVIAPDFLKSVFIAVWELEYWCKECNVPFPTFWVKPLVFGGRKVPIGDTLYSLELEEEEPGGEPDSAKTNSNFAPQTNLQQQNAALARHEPVNELKRECVLYWLANQRLSNAEASRRFYAALPPEKQRRLSKENAEVTLAKALSEYRNRDKKAELPYWLNGFNPEPPQTP